MKNCITFRKWTIQLSEQNTYSIVILLIPGKPFSWQYHFITHLCTCRTCWSHKRTDMASSPSLKQLSFQREECKQKSSLHLRLSSGSLGRSPHKAAPAVLDSPTGPFQLTFPTKGPPNTHLDTPAWGEWWQLLGTRLTEQTEITSSSFQGDWKISTCHPSH